MRFTSRLLTASPIHVLGDAVRLWSEHGVVVLPGLLQHDDMVPSQRELPSIYPTADEFHADADPDRNERFRSDQFEGIDEFPWSSTELNLLAVHPKVVAVAEALLATSDLRLYSAESWAKYTGATDYDQLHVNFRPAAADWHDRHAWAGPSYNPNWYRFVERATPRQPELFGFPAPGRDFWSAETVERLAMRYTGLDVRPWRDALR